MVVEAFADIILLFVSLPCSFVLDRKFTSGSGLPLYESVLEALTAVLTLKAVLTGVCRIERSCTIH